MTDGRLPDSQLPDDDDPWVWVDGRKLVVASSWGLAVPGGWVGASINALPTAPISGQFSFRVELTEVDLVGSQLAVLVETSSVTWIPTHATPLFQAYLPTKAPAQYCIGVRVARGGFDASVRRYIAVPPQTLEAQILPSRMRAGAGERLHFAVVNAGPTPLFFGDEYTLDRSVDGDWVNCNVEHSWQMVGHTVPPGGRRDEAAWIPENALPGRYRVSKDLNAVGTDVSRNLSFEFDVVPPRRGSSA